MRKLCKNKKKSKTEESSGNSDFSIAQNILFTLHILPTAKSLNKIMQLFARYFVFDGFKILKSVRE